MPADYSREEIETIQRMLTNKRITIVGASENPSRASHAISAYLVNHRFEVVPVNPNYKSVLGLQCFPSLDQVPAPVDLVNVFRRPEACGEVARQAIAVGATALWLQSGITSPEARRLARQANIDYVEDRCIMVEHSKLADPAPSLHGHQMD